MPEQRVCVRLPQGAAMTIPEGFYTTVRDAEDYDRYADHNTEDNT